MWGEHGEPAMAHGGRRSVAQAAPGHQSHSVASQGGSGLSSADLGLPHRSSAHPGAGWGRDLGTSRAAFARGCVQPSTAAMLPGAAKSCRALGQPRPNSSARPWDEGSAELPPRPQHRSLLWRSSSCGTGAAPLAPSAVPQGRSPKPLSASSGAGRTLWSLLSVFISIQPPQVF